MFYQSYQKTLRTLLVCFLSIGFLSVYGQEVQFADYNFEQHMIHLSKKLVDGEWVPIDSNGDEKIQISEAEDCEIVEIFCGKIIYTYTPELGFTIGERAKTVKGIEKFINLKEINFFAPLALEEEDLRALTKLERITFDHDGWAPSGRFKVDLRGLTNLHSVYDNGATRSINIAGCSNLKNISLLRGYGLSCANSDTLDFRGMEHLESVELNIDHSSEILFQNNSSLKTVKINEICAGNIDLSDANSLESIDIESSKELQFQIGQHPLLKSLNLRARINTNLIIPRQDELTYLHINSYDTIPVLHVETQPKLLELELVSVAEANIEFLEFKTLQRLYLTFFPLTKLTLNNLNELESIRVLYSPIQELELSDLPKLRSLQLGSTNLEKANLKNLEQLANLNLSSNPLRTLEIESLSSLKSITLQNTNIDSLSVTSFNRLSSLNIGSDSLRYIDLQQLDSLSHLRLSSKLLNYVSLSHLPTLESFYCDETPLDSINLNQLSELSRLSLINTNLAELQIPSSPMISYLNLSGNQLTEYDLSLHTNIKQINLSNNLLQSIDFSNLPVLDQITIDHNQLTSLNIENSSTLREISAVGNLLSTCELHSNTNLRNIFVADNQLKTFNLTNSPPIHSLSIENNELEYLDLSSTQGRIYLLTAYNNPLTYLNIKDGGRIFQFYSDEGVYNFPEDLIICADAHEEFIIEEAVLNTDLTNYYLTNFCPFYPGQEIYGMEGTVRFDAEQDGCTSDDKPIPQVKINLEHEIEKGFVIGNKMGIYKSFLGEGQTIVKTEFFNSNLFESSPDHFVVQFPQNENPLTQDFCIQKTAIDQADLSVVIIPTDISRPGFTNVLKVICSNEGNTALGGLLTIEYPSDLMFLETLDLGFDSNGDLLTYQLPILDPFEIIEFELQFRFAQPTNTPGLTGGEFVQITATIITEEEEINRINNQFTLVEQIVNSYDPNDKTCLEGNYLSPEKIGEYLHYKIRFENLGTAYATDIIVRDTIDTALFEINSLEVVDASHEVFTLVKEENIIEFVFENIRLDHQDDFNDGYVLFKIKTKEDLEIGQLVSNQAAIYFDFNPPILTNNEESVILLPEDFDVDGDGIPALLDCDDTNPYINNATGEIAYNGYDDDCNPLTLDDDFDQDGFGILEDCDDENYTINPLGEEIPGNGIDEDCDGYDLISNNEELFVPNISVYPNPTGDFVFIDCDFNLSLKVYNTMGQLVMDKTILIQDKKVDVSLLTPGSYLLEIRAEDRYIKMVKLVVY